MPRCDDASTLQRRRGARASRQLKEAWRMGAAEPQGAEPLRPQDRVGGRQVGLVVAEEPIIRQFVGRALDAAGIEHALAADGREALRAVADGLVQPQVLLTDIEMPGMSGIELAARVLALRPGLRVVM